MKKFIFSTMAAVLLFVTGASVSASASNFMPSPEKSAVEQFIALFNRFFVLNYLSSDLDSGKDASKISALDELMDQTAGEIVDLFDAYGTHVLSASEKLQIANFIDVLYTMSEGETDSKSLARIKNEVYNLQTLNDLYDAILNDQAVAPAPSMLTYTYKDVTIKYPATYEISTDDTTYGVHIYLQHEDIVPNSVFMEIEKIDKDHFAGLSASAVEKFLREECQNYYDRYIDNDYKINWKTDISYYDDTRMAIIALSGVQYGHEFTGEILTLLNGDYQFTAFITGIDDASEQETRQIFLSALE